jgi:pimeloyl-ACP methyl ester carboxylesterase
MRSDLVRRFCTPPSVPPTDREKEALTAAEMFEVPFEGKRISCYGWGKGRTILLAHGWGSRASHLALLGRHLAGASFRAVAFDAPAHSSLVYPVRENTSNMFEFSRALTAVARWLGEVYCLVGHSLGAAAAAFTVSGFPRLEACKFDVQKLVLVSAPSSVASLLDNFCSRNDLNVAAIKDLRRGLESAFDMSVDVYSVGKALHTIRGTRMMLIHDNKDSEFPIGEAFKICRETGNIRLFVTDGYGHARILTNRNVLKEIKQFVIYP